MKNQNVGKKYALGVGVCLLSILQPGCVATNEPPPTSLPVAASTHLYQKGYDAVVSNNWAEATNDLLNLPGSPAQYLQMIAYAHAKQFDAAIKSAEAVKLSDLPTECRSAVPQMVLWVLARNLPAKTYLQHPDASADSTNLIDLAASSVSPASGQDLRPFTPMNEPINHDLQKLAYVAQQVRQYPRLLRKFGLNNQNLQNAVNNLEANPPAIQLPPR